MSLFNDSLRMDHILKQKYFQSKYYQVNCGTYLCLGKIVIHFKNAGRAFTNSGTSKFKAAKQIKFVIKND